MSAINYYTKHNRHILNNKLHKNQQKSKTNYPLLIATQRFHKNQPLLAAIGG